MHPCNVSELWFSCRGRQDTDRGALEGTGCEILQLWIWTRLQQVNQISPGGSSVLHDLTFTTRYSNHIRVCMSHLLYKRWHRYSLTDPAEKPGPGSCLVYIHWTDKQLWNLTHPPHKCLWGEALAHSLLKAYNNQHVCIRRLIFNGRGLCGQKKSHFFRTLKIVWRPNKHRFLFSIQRASKFGSAGLNHCPFFLAIQFSLIIRLRATL